VCFIIVSVAVGWLCQSLTVAFVVVLSLFALSFIILVYSILALKKQIYLLHAFYHSLVAYSYAFHFVLCVCAGLKADLSTQKSG
jgi:hypothetical protein